MADEKPPLTGMKAVADILQTAARDQAGEADGPADDDTRPAAARGELPAPDAAPPETPADDPFDGLDPDDLSLKEPEAPAPLKPGTKPKTLAEAAQLLGCEIGDLYKLQVPMSDGDDAMTLGKMKDHASNAVAVEGMTVELDDRRASFENEMIRARQELNEVIGLLPAVPPALIERAQQAHIEHLDRERAALLAIKPEWRDDSVFQAAQGDILEAVADYGFSRADLDLVVDHRLTKLLFDFAGLKTRVAKANARAKEIASSQPRAGKKLSDSQRRAAATAAAVSQSKQQQTPQSRTAAVAALLRNADK